MIASYVARLKPCPSFDGLLPSLFRVGEGFMCSVQSGQVKI
jgi:hypothetical protein